MAPVNTRCKPIEPRHHNQSPTPVSRNASATYRGRFAPSPTGPLHFGSVIAAVGSFLEARRQNGAWLVRIDDLDGPRTAPGAADAILADLERLGMGWDGEVCYQQPRREFYRRAMEQLRAAAWTFSCGCSRKDFRGIYPGTCREGLAPGKRARTRRVRVADACIELHDAVQGDYRQLLNESVGDFVIRRADGIFAYHLAVVVDDSAFGITEVVRGADLLASTPRQIHLQRCLGLPTPAYAHLPVIVNASGQKLSKQTFAEPVSDKPAVPLLVDALAFLGQQPEARLRDASLDELWSWAIGNWDMNRVPRQRAIHWPNGKPVHYIPSKTDKMID